MSADRPLTGWMRADGGALGLGEYRRLGGYGALTDTLRGGRTPAGLVQLVADSGLRGRGGAGFNTGQKWSFVPRGADAPQPKYLLVNADELEPGTFKDRRLLEGNPHQLLEGMLLAGYAIGARHGFIFLRANYHQAERRLAAALAEASDAGLLGGSVLGSDFAFDIQLHVSAGRYICGEETALINALQGERPVPRAKPPFPQVSGLFGKPTIVNNVETLCNVPPIVARGAAWYRSLGRGADAGTKLFGVSGRVRRPGLWELPMGTPVREVIEECAGGMRDGFRLRGFLPGGASTDFLLPGHLDLPLDFDAVQKAGSRLGTGTMVVLDDRTCPVGFVHNLIAFFARESCGWCTPCREGLPWIESLLADLESGHGRPGDLDLLDQLAARLAPGLTFCPLAPGAMEPLQSALRHFRADFEGHLDQGRCPGY